MYTERQPLIESFKRRFEEQQPSTTIQNNNKKCQKSLFLFVTFSIILVIALLSFAMYFYPISAGNSTRKEVRSQLREERLLLVTNDDGLTDDAKSDLITSLPGLTVDINDLGYNMYAGYVDVDNTESDGIDDDVQKQLFYWLYECDCENPDEQPLILWTNGGPGCSGMEGNLVEHGGLLIQSDLTLSPNEYSWNKLANIIYIEQPFGVGFSVPSNGQVVGGDVNAAVDMNSFLRHFLEKFPKYANNKIIISSESWGGHYMPMTAFQILTNNANGQTPYLNFEGILVGNPYTDYYENWIGWMEALYGHGLLKQSTYETWRSLCYEKLPDLENADCTLNYIQSYIDSISVDYYALDYPKCTLIDKADDDLSSTLTSDVSSDTTSEYRWYERFITRRVEELYEEFEIELDLTDDMKLQFQEALSLVKGASNIPYIACADEYMPKYFNQEDVQEALHVKKKDVNWAICSDAVYYAWDESDYYNGMETVYHSLLDDFKTQNKIKIVIFSGDDDSVCGTPGTQYWLRNMGFDIDIDYDWKEWKIDDELAGFYTRFLYPGTNDTTIHFQTVRSAGHMVPQTQPKKGYYLLDRYLNFYQG